MAFPIPTPMQKINILNSYWMPLATIATVETANNRLSRLMPRSRRVTARLCTMDGRPAFVSSAYSRGRKTLRENRKRPFFRRRNAVIMTSWTVRATEVATPIPKVPPCKTRALTRSPAMSVTHMTTAETMKYRLPLSITTIGPMTCTRIRAGIPNKYPRR